MKRFVLLSGLLAVSALAGELKGQKMADAVEVDGKTLKLNGMGLRVKVIVSVYVAGLYLETPSKNAPAILKADEGRRVVLAMLRDLDQKTIVEAIRTGFDKNSAAQLPALKERLDTFCALIPSLKEGQTLTLSYTPGKGTSVVGAGSATVIPGKDFADALFAVWLGTSPVDDGLKKGMLGL
jgi:Chalcone isomerase-like